MTDGEYLFDAMSKIPRFANWLKNMTNFIQEAVIRIFYGMLLY